jgi:hypothetical protein
MFEQTEPGIGGKGEQGGRDGPGEDEAIVDRSDAAEDEFT